jgi:diacylglycerol O-acyltransferase/trehalose O-mycolyltransferase
MGAHDMHQRLIATVAIVALAAGCAGSSSAAPTTVATAGLAATLAATATATPGTPTPAPAATPAPTPTLAPTIGEPADDGASIIAVETPTGADPVTDARTRDLTIDSPAVGVVQVRLLLPQHFAAQPSTRWPVLYVLPGSSSGHDGWSGWSDLESLTAPTDLLVVVPDAGHRDPGGSSYLDWWNGGDGGPPMWETFHLVELLQLLERNWQAGDRRAVVGVSAGGYGAMEYASRRPGMFLLAAAYSGVFDPVGHVAFWSPPSDWWGSPVAQADIWKAHDPLLNAEALRGTRLYVAYGNGKPGALDDFALSPYDPTGEVEREVATESAALVKRLHELKIPVTVYAYGNGTHNGPYINRDLDRSFPLILKALGE